MNIDKLMSVRNRIILENLPVDMGNFVGIKVDGQLERRLEAFSENQIAEKTKEFTCNTVGCIAGWGMILDGTYTFAEIIKFIFDGEETEVASKIFDLKGGESTKLFFPDCWLDDFSADYPQIFLDARIVDDYDYVTQGLIVALYIPYFIKYYENVDVITPEEEEALLKKIEERLESHEN
jgi:hypothetical protein